MRYLCLLVLGMGVAPAIAQAAPDSPCFLVRPGGKIQDLSALCGKATPQPPATTAGRFTVPIVRRQGRIPIVALTVAGPQGEKTVEAILDTGAGMTVLTAGLANTLGIVPVGTGRIRTASDRQVRMPIGYAQSLRVGPHTARNVPVVLNQSIDVALLGQDFLDNLEVTIRRDTVEFRPIAP
ncbi:MAG: retropepsin-like aspartic protease family protein [Pseudanabaenaceae cyanobacterium]